MNICFISYDYPDERRSVFPFVKQLVDEIARQGHVCQVIAPYSITNNKRFHKYKEVQNQGQGKVIIYRPNYLSVGNLSIKGCSLTFLFQKKAINYALNRLEKKPDAVYGHFWNYGLYGYVFAKKNKLPLFIASGESSILLKYNEVSDKDFFDYVKGVICVSSKNKYESIVKHLTTEEKCVVIPNAVDTQIFRLLDKKECRKNLNIKTDDFVVAFVGGFIERKGVLRVSNALKKIRENNIKAIFIGGGTQDPDCPNILFKGKLPHSEVAKYLNASDVFVLPTQAEGCCNAIIEAMACGLPIVSSNLSFNWDVLNNSNSIMIDPNNVDEIAKAIILIKNNKELRESMSKAALKTASELTIDARAKKIIDFIKSRL